MEEQDKKLTVSTYDKTKDNPEKESELARLEREKNTLAEKIKTLGGDFLHEQNATKQQS